MDSATANWIFDAGAAVLTVSALVLAVVFARSSARSARAAEEAVGHAASAADDAWKRVFEMQQLTSELRAEIRALRVEIALRTDSSGERWLTGSQD